jgi:hypothetical protein
MLLSIALATALQAVVAVLAVTQPFGLSIADSASYLLTGITITLMFLAVGVYLRTVTPDMYLRGWHYSVSEETAQSTVKLLHTTGLALIVSAALLMPLTLWLAFR